MVDTIRTLSALQTLLADNTSGDISAQDLRDMLVSLEPTYGQVSQAGNASATTIAGTVDYYEATLSGTSLSAVANNTDSPASGRLRYTGSTERFVLVVCTFTFVAASGSQELHFRLGKSGTFSAETEIMHSKTSSNEEDTACIQWLTTLTNNQYVSLGIRNATGATNVTVPYITLTMLGAIT